MPVLDAQSLEFLSRSVEQTRRLGIRLGMLLQEGDLICLAGELGSGKTTLVQGIASGWGSLDRVTSPTFVLVNVYRRPDRKQLFHLDAYRLWDSKDVEELDIDNYIETGSLVVEWSDRIHDSLPKEHLWISLNWVDEFQRDLLLTAYGDRYQNTVHELRKQIFGVF